MVKYRFIVWGQHTASITSPVLIAVEVESAEATLKALDPKCDEFERVWIECCELFRTLSVKPEGN